MSEKTVVENKETSDVEEQQSVRCKRCNYDITDPSCAIQPHEHTFRNREGYSFHLLCYSDAPGAADVGVPTSDFSWFSGYSWSMAICAQCFAHLGWWFIGPTRFAGLIATRLIR